MKEFTGGNLRHQRDEDRPLIDRLLETPQLALVVPRLQPELLHRVIEHCGLEDCAELVALATPGQLRRIFDLDLWRAGQPGDDEQFDADRFGVWLAVLLESGVAVAAQKIAAMDAELMTTGFAQHLRVFDRAAVAPYETPDGGEAAPIRAVNDQVARDIGGYVIVARRPEAPTPWDAIGEVLTALSAGHHDYFDRMMRGCRAQSHSTHEIDGLHDLLGHADQMTFDVAVDRERRRETLGYTTPAQARAFLEMSRQLAIRHDAAPPTRNPVARAYFRAMDETPADRIDTANAPARWLAGSETAAASDDSAAADAVVVGVIDMLRTAGLVPQPPRALLHGLQDHAARLARIAEQMQFVIDHDGVAFSARNGELAYLANTIVAGCSIQARPFTALEASDAAVAVCNLGLENWPARWLRAKAGGLPDDFLVGQDLIGVFQVGWTVLHDEVCMFAAERLVEVLKQLRCADREIQRGLDALRIAMRKQWRAGTPWAARDALDVIASLDLPAWATLLGMIDECPVVNAAIAASQGSRILKVSASEFDFISENRQIAAVRQFMESLPQTLRP